VLLAVEIRETRLQFYTLSGAESRRAAIRLQILAVGGRAATNREPNSIARQIFPLGATLTIGIAKNETHSRRGQFGAAFDIAPQDRAPGSKYSNPAACW